MKILSRREWEFLNEPSKFSENYQRVLRHRIREKTKSMMLVLELISSKSDAMLPKRELEKVTKEREKAKLYGDFLVAHSKVGNQPEAEELASACTEKWDELMKLKNEGKITWEEVDAEWYRTKQDYWRKMIELVKKLE